MNGGMDGKKFFRRRDVFLIGRVFTVRIFVLFEIIVDQLMFVLFYKKKKENGKEKKNRKEKI